MRLMRTTKLKLSRADLAVIFSVAAAIALIGALVLELLGLPVHGVRPVAFISAVICVKLGLFTFWPTISKKGGFTLDALREMFPLPAAGLTPRSATAPQSSLKLWNGQDLRLEQSLFAGNVPTFVLSNDQRFLDWNTGFEMIFGACPGMRRGGHVRDWYELLDNFKRVPKRTDKLYGEGLLPITDRERATFVSDEFGRMVFTRIMTPIVDRSSGRIVGWTVVLNINSVNKRQEFFERLHDALALETRRLRHAASYDGLFDRFPERQALISTYVDQLARPASATILEVGCGTGALTAALLGEGHKVTAVEDDTHLLRSAKERTASFAKVKLVRHPRFQLQTLPPAHYDTVILAQRLPSAAETAAVFAAVHTALRPNGRFLLQLRADGATVEALFELLKERLTEAACFDELKHQYNHVLDFERDAQAARSADPLSVAQALRLLAETGFVVEAELDQLEDGQTVLIIAHK